MENGKVLEEARGEVQEGIDMAFYMAGEGSRLFGQTTPAELKDKFAMRSVLQLVLSELLPHGISRLLLRHGSPSRPSLPEMR